MKGKDEQGADYNGGNERQRQELAEHAVVGVAVGRCKVTGMGDMMGALLTLGGKGLFMDVHSRQHHHRYEYRQQDAGKQLSAPFQFFYDTVLSSHFACKINTFFLDSVIIWVFVTDFTFYFAFSFISITFAA